MWTTKGTMVRATVAMLLACDIGSVFGSPINSKSAQRRDTAANTADTSDLKTWWHSTGEVNTKTPVKDENVRKSHKYSVQVSTDGSKFYDSFVYESIPRNGNGNICKPNDLSSVCNVDDQISIEPDIGVTMAWTQFLHGKDATVKITRTDGGSVAAEDVTIRPTNLGFKKSTSGQALLITVPYNANGHRFSVEFKDDLWEYRNSGPGTQAHYVQNKNPNGQNYVSSYTDDMPVVGIEPTNALLIFASAFPDESLVPNDAANTYKVPAGLIKNLDNVDKPILYFEPGVYWFGGANHAKLPQAVTWVYLAPGAYVKGAFEYQSQEKDLRATGFGVVSGEQYVYQANTAQGYENIKSDDTSLKMWRGEVANGMSWTIHGLTTNAPPFNSMDFYASDLGTLSVQASDYKQVGAFFGQTDGMEIYPNSHIHDVFYHVGDDGIKTYYSHVQVERMIVWKSNNAPIVQFGWYARDVEDVTVDTVDVIHTRYMGQAPQWPRALVASAASYTSQDSMNSADTNKHLKDYTISNWRSEGISCGLLGINPMQNIDNFLMENIWIEEMSPATTQVGMSTFTVFTDGNKKPIELGGQSKDHLGLIIKNFQVGSEKITLAANNWDMSGPGMINFDKSYWGNWTAI